MLGFPGCIFGRAVPFSPPRRLAAPRPRERSNEQAVEHPLVVGVERAAGVRGAPCGYAPSFGAFCESGGADVALTWRAAGGVGCSFHYSCVLNSGCEYNPSTRQVYCHIHAQPAGSEWQHTGEWQSWDEEQRSVTPPAPAPPVARKHPRSRAGELPIGMGGQRVQYEDLHSEPPDEAREGWESEMEDDQPGAPGLANGMLRNGQPSVRALCLATRAGAAVAAGAMGRPAQTFWKRLRA